MVLIFLVLNSLVHVGLSEKETLHLKQNVSTTYKFGCQSDLSVQVLNNSKLELF